MQIGQRLVGIICMQAISFAADTWICSSGKENAADSRKVMFPGKARQCLRYLEI